MEIVNKTNEGGPALCMPNQSLFGSLSGGVPPACLQHYCNDLNPLFYSSSFVYVWHQSQPAYLPFLSMKERFWKEWKVFTYSLCITGTL